MVVEPAAVSVDQAALSAERRLSSVLSEFARTLVTDFPIQAILDHLVIRIVDVLPVSAAGVTLIAPGTEPRYVAASDESALRFEQLQTELGEGPCIVTYRSGKAVSIPDLRDDLQFPAFTPRALDAGLRAVFTFPLRQGAARLGALDLYRTSAGPLNETEMAAAQTLADVAAAYLINAQNRVDLQESSENYRCSALHDALTGLPNRALLVERLEHAIARCLRPATSIAILFADLDQFKSINDGYGHRVGDELLIAVAKRLNGLLRPGDTLARQSGDEFVILCEDLSDGGEAEQIARRVGAALAQPFQLSVGKVRMTASVGIAFAGKGDEVPEKVLQDADAAMYQVKRRGGARHGVIDLREQSLARHRSGLTRDLHGALERGEMRLAYQPIVATAGATTVAVEALLRWHHPQQGVISPEVSVVLAERSGLISEIGSWVLHQACREQRRWQTVSGRQGIGVCVNLSAQQLMAPEFSAGVAEVLTESGVDPKLVTLEVTEGVFLQDGERALVVLKQLKKLGVELALDDFGTGYSSLSYLQRFPVDIVKIDRNFVSGLTRDRASRLIVDSVVGLAHGLDMKVVAEGVETSEQYEAVAALGCDRCQGYYFGRPMYSERLDVFLGGPGATVPRAS